MVVLGLLLGTVGTDINTDVQRFTFGLPNLYDGLDFVAVAVGLFAVAEIVWRLQHHHAQAQPLDKVRGLLPRWEDIAATWKPILRGTALGGALGILPGTGPLISSFASYGLERSLARDPVALRQRRDRGSGRAGSGEQRCRADPFHSHADAGDSRRRCQWR